MLRLRIAMPAPTGFDAAAVVAVIEHLNPARLERFEQVLLAHERPSTIVLTPPNIEYNAENLDTGALRHSDHRFEWDRAPFASSATGVAEKQDDALDI